MLVISRETDYAARVLLHLSLEPAGSRVTAHAIAADRLVPAALLRRIVTRLAVAGLIRTARGSSGGISLARSAGDITLLQLVEAMEGPVALNACTVDPAACPLIISCSVHEAWMNAHNLLVEHLKQTTFAALAERGRQLEDELSVAGKGGCA